MSTWARGRHFLIHAPNVCDLVKKDQRFRSRSSVFDGFSVKIRPKCKQMYSISRVLLKGSWKGNSLYTNIIMHFIWVSKVLTEDNPLRLLLEKGPLCYVVLSPRPPTLQSSALPTEQALSRLTNLPSKLYLPTRNITNGVTIEAMVALSRAFPRLLWKKFRLISYSSIFVLNDCSSHHDSS